MATTQEILDRLNAYEDQPPHECGPQCTTPCTAPEIPTVWSEIIHRLPEYDPDGVADLGEFALRDGTTIRWDGEVQKWIAVDHDPRIDPGWLHL